MAFTAFIVVGSSLSLIFYLSSAEKDKKIREDANKKLIEDGKDHLVKDEDKKKVTKKFTFKDMLRLDKRYYILLFIRFCVMGAWFGFSAMFMQYLEAACHMEFRNAALLIVINPFIALTVVFTNTFVNRKWDILNEALFGCALMVSIFLWISGLVVEKGMGMAIFGIVAISISGGFFNVIIDSKLATTIDPDLTSVGTGISMSMKGISCLIFPFVNGMFMGQTATPQSIANCCLFMAIPCTIGFVLICWYIWIDKKQEWANLKLALESEKEAKVHEEGRDGNLSTALLYQSNDNADTTVNTTFVDKSNN